MRFMKQLAVDMPVMHGMIPSDEEAGGGVARVSRLYHGNDLGHVVNCCGAAGAAARAQRVRGRSIQPLLCVRPAHQLAVL